MNEHTNEPEESTASDTSLPNWRVVTQQDIQNGAAEKALNTRQEWSDASYQQALEWYDALQQCNDTYMADDIHQALHQLHDAYRLYGPTLGVIGSFNGGKDACVILELLRAAHAHYFREMRATNPSVPIYRPRVVYWDKEGEFREVLDFTKDNVHRYDLDMIAFEQGIPFTDGLKILVEAQKTPMAFVLGTRASDPNAKGQGAWEPSSASFMPPFMRVNPVLNWNYGKVWQFLRSYQLPVCSLYKDGYTSLGTVHDTNPNPALYVPPSNSQEVGRYREAWMLLDYDQERSGRVSKKSAKEAPAVSQPPQSSGSSPKTTGSSAIPKATTSSSSPPQTVQVSNIPKEVSPPSKQAGAMPSDVSFGSDTVTQRTVGLLIIGDEILKGYTPDTNSKEAAIALGRENVGLKRIVVVSDDMDEISDEISRMQEQVDVIVTSGGVGPTHDDVTIKSVAQAIGSDLVLHPEMAQLLKDKMGTEDELNEAQIKMATLPSVSKLRYLSSNEHDWPVLQCKNIFILPGVPEFFAAKIQNVAVYLSCQLERSTGYKVVLSADENSLVSYLNQVVERHPQVSFGSYPFVNQPDHKTVITVEGKLAKDSLVDKRNSVIFNKADIDSCKEDMNQHVQKALDDLIATLPPNCVVRVDVDDMLLF